MTLDYFYGAQADLFTFYRIPKALFTEERFKPISAEAKILYGILLDRTSLSQRNGWLDEDNRVFIIFTLDEVMNAIGCADQKATKLLSELENKAGLIERKRQGLGKPNLIYVKNFVDNPVGSPSGTQESRIKSRENHDSGTVKITNAEIKALCAGDDRIREKMDLDVDVARLKLMKANHQSQQYRLEDNILRNFPAQIEQNMGYIAGFQADMATLAEHPHPQDGFAGMTVRGDNLIDKENAGAALLDAMKEVKGLEPVPIGNYRGFQMSLTLEDFGKQYILTLKGKMSHRVELGKDARGNLIRIDNALSNMESRLARVQEKLDTLHAQMENAKTELGKPFPQEQELKEKSARLAELNNELNIDDKTPIEAMIDASEPTQDTRPAVTAKAERTSVLAKLRAPLPQRDNHTKTENEKEER